MSFKNVSYHFWNFSSRLQTCNDYLNINQEDSLAANLADNYCGSLIPSSRIIESNKAFLRFQSDKYDSENRGFKLEYHSYSKFYHI